MCIRDSRYTYYNDVSESDYRYGELHYIYDSLGRSVEFRYGELMSGDHGVYMLINGEDPAERQVMTCLLYTSRCV